jgi:hypothetical protein
MAQLIQNSLNKILEIFIIELTVDEENYEYFYQESAPAHTTENSLQAHWAVLSESIIIRRLAVTCLGSECVSFLSVGKLQTEH